MKAAGDPRSARAARRPGALGRAATALALAASLGLAAAPEAGAVSVSYHTDRGGRDWGNCAAPFAGMVGAIVPAATPYVCTNSTLTTGINTVTYFGFIGSTPYAADTMVAGDHLYLYANAGVANTGLQVELGYSADNGATIVPIGYVEQTIGTVAQEHNVDMTMVKGLVPSGAVLTLRVLGTTVTGGQNVTFRFGTTASASGNVRFSVFEEEPCRDAVRNLAVVDRSGTWAKISWEPAHGADSYGVYRDGALVGSTAATEYTDSALGGNTTYNYTVVANSSSRGCSTPASSPLAVKTCPFTASPESLDFGQVAVGTPLLNTITVTSHMPSGTALVNSVTIAGGDASQFSKTADTCTGQNLAALATCTIGLTFTPNGEGDRETTLNVNSSSWGGAQLAIKVRGGLHTGPYLLREIRAGGQGSTVAATGMISDGQHLYFKADDGVHRAEPWVSNGTASGTTLLKDVRTTMGSSPASFTAMDGWVYFAADDGVSGNELWRTDGSAQGTVLFKNIFPGSGSGNPTNFAVSPQSFGNDYLYFQATSAPGAELWRSDGSAAGTAIYKDIVNPGSSSPANLIPFRGRVVFTGGDGTYASNTLYTTGSQNGSVVTLFTAAQADAAGPPVAVGTTLFFAGLASGSGMEIWSSDGTPAGTSLLRNINTTAGVGSSPANLTSCNGLLFFAAADATNGVELWKSDGTTAGTVLVRNINTTAGAGSSPRALLCAGSTLYFAASNGATNGEELWKSDGTTAGTVMVKDICPGATGSSIQTMASLAGKVYFEAGDGTNGQELWVSDGTPTGTTMVRDFWPGAGGAGARDISVMGGTIYYRAQTASSGWEVFTYSPNMPPTFSGIGSQAAFEGETIGPLEFTVGDAHSDPGSLLVTATSGNATLLPNANITLAGTGATRTIRLTPAAGQVGSTLVTVTVSDGVNSIQGTFWASWTRVLRVPSAYATIQDAINAAGGGDLVLVGDGTYTGTGNKNLDYAGKAISVRSENGAAQTVIDCQGSGSGVLFDSADPAGATLEGFTITRASTGAIVVNGASPTIKDCTFLENFASGFQNGGALRVLAGGNPSVAGCTFRGNRATSGGAANVDAPGVPGLPMFSRCVFENNTAAINGGAIQVVAPNGIILEDCLFRGNFAGSSGGAINHGAASLNLRRCTLAYNTCASGGGGIYGSGQLSVSDSLFLKNVARADGGAIYTFDHSIVNATFTGNEAGARGGSLYAAGTGSLYNSILWGNTADQGGQVYVSNATTLALGYSDLQGGTAGIFLYDATSLLTVDGTILDQDPLFALSEDAHLLPDSPCRDAGSNSPAGGLSSLDLNGLARVYNATVDLGANEFHGAGDVPEAAISPLMITLHARVGGTVPDRAFVEIRNAGGGTLRWKVSEDASWLRLEPVEGESTGETDRVGVYADHTDLAKGIYQAGILVEDADSATTLRQIPVTLLVNETLTVDKNNPTVYLTIQEAIDAAIPGDTVLVKNGTYTGAGNKDLDFRGKGITLTSENGPQYTVIDCENSGRGFTFTSGEPPEAVIEGFTVTRGSAYDGGAVYVTHGSPRIVNCTFVSNAATHYGGAVYASDAIDMRSCTIKQNTATDRGGGAYLWPYQVQTSINGCWFEGNTSGTNGGAIYIAASPTFVDECAIISNTAVAGGGIYDAGAGTIRNSTLAGNHATSNGGGIYSSGAASVISNCVLAWNYACATVAGGVCSTGTTQNGGGLYLWNGGSTVNNCTLYGNQASYYGGGLYHNITGGSAPSFVANTLFWSNSRINAGGGGHDITDITSNVKLYNSAFRYDLDPPTRLKGATFYNVDLSATGAGDPKFVNADGWDWRLESTSPCIDKGRTISSIYSDRLGSVRAVDADNDGIPEFDIGALEYSGYYGGGENQVSKAFKDLRINGTQAVTSFEYRIEWRDNDPFPFDLRIRQSQKYGVRLALVSDRGLRVELGEWTMPVSQIGYTIPYVFGQEHIGIWRIRIELASDPNQYALTDQVTIEYKQAQTYYMGQWIQPPRNADPAVKPDWDNPKACYWSVDTNRLYAVAPYTTVVTWYADKDRKVAIPTLAYITYPEPQVHISGTPTVKVLPQGTRFDSATVVWTDSDAVINGTDFNATLEGWSTILYRDAQGVGAEAREAFEVVRTLAWNHKNPLIPADPVFPIETTWTIGSLVKDAEHRQAECGSGFVYFEDAYYDGAGDQKAYDRAHRTGQIFPVNEDNPDIEADDLVVAWYQKSKVGDGCWPFKPVRYDPVWPAGTNACRVGSFTTCDEIVIASALGSGPLPPSVYGPQENMIVYDQRDRSLPGFNPNEEHAMLFAAQDSQYPAAFALRTDLNRQVRRAPNYTSHPCVLLKYVEPATGEWNMRAFMVTPEVAPDLTFSYEGTAGTEINPPYPVSQLVFGPCDESSTTTPAEVHRDKDQKFFAKAGPVAGSPVDGGGKPYMPATLRYFYRLQPAFDLDTDNNGVQDELPSTCIPWLDQGTGTPVDVHYRVAWPDLVPTLFVGETLTDAKTQENEPVGLPNVKDQCVAGILFDQSDREAPGHRAAKLIDPLKEYALPLNPVALAGLRTNYGPDGRRMFIDLPYHLQQRLTYDALDTGGPPNFYGTLKLRGKYLTSTGEPMLLLNALTGRDLAVVNALPNRSAAFMTAVQSLATLGSGGLAGTPILKDAAMKALTAGDAQGTGYLTLVFNDDVACNAPTMMSVIKVGCPLYRGQVKVVESANPFDEKLTLRHNGDFGGGSDQRWFQWMYRVADFSGIPDGPPDDVIVGPGQWLPYSDILPLPAGFTPGYPPGSGIGSGNLWYRGAVDTTIQGTGQQLLDDKWFVARYYCDGVCSGTVSPWTEPQLYEGWLKRVMKKINLYDQRVADFHKSDVNTLASMISQAGRRYEGDAALNDDPAYIQHVGLIELYETLLRRARELSIDGTPQVNLTGLNKAILFAANRLAGLYALLGNEAYADATDPTIGFSTEDGQYGTEAPSIFAFQNQADSLLEEEEFLLRGRDDAGTAPTYNRVLWNFTIDDGEVAYRESYNVTDQDKDGDIDEGDAMVLYPQGHGDAWGHYLTAMSKYYGLITHDYFDWEPQSEAILVGQTPVSVDYRDERRFASVAAAKARAGADVVALAYRDFYQEDRTKQWQGYEDDDRARAWGLADWAGRAGQGAYVDWVVGNALLPPASPDDHLTTGPRDCFAGDRIFTIANPDYFRDSMRVTVNGVVQSPASYTVTQQYFDIAGTRDWNTVVTFAASPCGGGTTISFQVDIQPQGIQRIDRTRVTELQEITAQADAVQRLLDQADAGLNPLGVAEGAVPFDIDPARIAQGETHFEQVYGRAVQALNNAIAVFNHANESSQLLRRQQDRLEDFQRNVENTEAEFTSRLVELYGTPYPDDCGAGKTYPAEYCATGPDVYHYMYVDPPNTYDDMNANLYTFKVDFTNQEVDASGNLTVSRDRVDYQYNLAPDGSYGVRKPSSWYGWRRVTGSIQGEYLSLYRARMALQEAVKRYQEKIDEMEDASKDLVRRWGKEDAAREIRLIEMAAQRDRDDYFRTAKEVKLGFQLASRLATMIAEGTAEGIPGVIGLIAGVASGTVTDMLSAVRSGIRLAGEAVSEISSLQENVQDIILAEIDAEKAVLRDERNLALDDEERNYQRAKDILDMQKRIREEYLRRAEVFDAVYGVQTAAQNVLGALGKAERLLADRVRFRQQTAAQTQEYRYKDMTFRIFRNDALQKYRAQFDLAARYVYLAAKAYDYETTLLGADSMAGRAFLQDIVRQRSIGMVESGQPLTGTGLADPMRRMWQNFQVLKPQLGFENPQREANRFSLRQELLRVGTSAGSGDAWRTALAGYRVDNLWDVPEFSAYCRPYGEPGTREPGLVIPFRTTVTSGLNFFAWPLAGGDSFYSPSNFATKVRSVGVWFSNYNNVTLSQTPRVYLIPVGEDMLRTPDNGVGEVRVWKVVDQKLPVPFPVNVTEMSRDANWIPEVNSVSDRTFEIRRHSDFRAYHDSGYFDKSEMSYDSRLIGRSVWNSGWLLIIPGRTLLEDPDEGLDALIYGPERFGGTGERTGNGVSDIKIFFETYSYSGD